MDRYGKCLDEQLKHQGVILQKKNEIKTQGRRGPATHLGSQDKINKLFKAIIDEAQVICTNHAFLEHCI